MGSFQLVQMVGGIKSIVHLILDPLWTPLNCPHPTSQVSVSRDSLEVKVGKIFPCLPEVGNPCHQYGIGGFSKVASVGDLVY